LSYSEWSERRDALSPLLFDASLECAIRNVLENKEGLELSRTHQLLLVYADDLLNYWVET
jgi:hypothetical protein